MTQRFLRWTIRDIARVPMIPDDIIESEFGGEIDWGAVEGSPGMVEFTGNAEIFLEEKSPSDTYWSQFHHGDINLLRDHYQTGTNMWAAE